MDIKGLPEGIQAVRFGIAGPEDFELINDTGSPDGHSLRKGPRAGSSTQIIVLPQDGWSFVPKYNIQILEERFVVAKRIDPPETTVITFRATNTYEQECIRGLLANLKAVPGYVVPE